MGEVVRVFGREDDARDDISRKGGKISVFVANPFFRRTLPKSREYPIRTNKKTVSLGEAVDFGTDVT